MVEQLPLFPDEKKRDKREIVGWTKHFWHKWAKKRIYAKPGSAFPIYRK
jgi:hypothetical protein